jgi:hypothetical protein
MVDVQGRTQGKTLMALADGDGGWWVVKRRRKNFRVGEILIFTGNTSKGIRKGIEFTFLDQNKANSIPLRSF